MSNKASDKRYKITLTEKQLALVGTAVEGMMNDLISRQAAIEVVDAVWCVTGDKNVAKVWDQIKDLPSAQPELRRGEES